MVQILSKFLFLPYRHDRIMLLSNEPHTLHKPHVGLSASLLPLFSHASSEAAISYLARSTGQVRISAVRKYLDQQSAHHGYDSRLLPPVYRYRAKEPTILMASHATFELTHHLVLSTWQRKGIFDSSLGRTLNDYWLRVATKRGFAIDQLSVVPDHIHLIVRMVPSMSIEECALLLMNNGQHFVGKNYPQVMIEAGINQLWQPSAYAGTCGDYTSGLIQKWLNAPQ